MPSSRIRRGPISRRALAATAGVALAVTGLAITPANANLAGTGLVISEVYGGGGNLGATWKNDFVELYNPTSAPISVAGMSVQYRSSASTVAASNVTALTGSVPAGGHYLVAQSAGAGGTDDLPTPDAIGTAAMSGTAFQAWLAEGTAALNPPVGEVAGTVGVVDFVGVNANSFEGAKTGGTSNTTSASRNTTGTDTNNNFANFTIGAPSPTNSGGGTPPPPDEFTGTIAEIQGTDTPTSPHVGDIATTEGVVTAAYPTGGFNGFYLQTPATGGGTDATPGASDAIFVYGSAATGAVAKGDHVQVVGLVKEYAGTTEIETDSAGDVTHLSVATTPTALATELPATEAAREAHEGELMLPTGNFTVTDNYSTNQYAEIGLASGNTTLRVPTDVADAQDATAIAAVNADNFARGVYLDDGASTNYLSAVNQGTPLPYLSIDNPIRVESDATFTAPVILEYRNSQWNYQPTQQLTAAGTPPATFENTRPANEAPTVVGGDIRLATFNVLNYFNTTGVDYVAAGGGHTCSYYNDRVGDPVTNNTCSPNGPRGAAEAEDLERQQVKIVTAINKLGASIVSLEEIENSVALGEANRDDALSTLVDALNAAAGTDTWAFAPSPAAEDLPPTAEQDVIRTAFIYKPAAVSLVGPSKVLVGSAAFTDAREPLAQAFQAVGAPADTTFAVIVNHFKSKGSGADDGTGQGNANPDRIAQAEALNVFADSFAADHGTNEVFLTGDFNSYTQEDPLQVLYGYDFTNLESDTVGESTYSFGGQSGSLDHVLANPGALAWVTGVDIWNINSVEALAFEYSRHNYNVTNFYEPNQFRASDHDPEIVGIDIPGFPVVAPPTVESKMKVKATPHHVVVDQTRVTLDIRVDAKHVTPTGQIQVTADGRTYSVQLENGRALVELEAFGSAGKRSVSVDYLGEDTVKPSSETIHIMVKDKKHR